MAFIRKVKTGSGATAIQIAHKRYGKIERIEHIGSGHNEADVQALMVLARKQLQGDQQSLFTEERPQLRITLKQSHSRLLFRMLMEVYKRLGFEDLHDEELACLCIARIVEPTSKVDSLRVLSELGITHLNKDRLYRCLKRIITQDYRSKISNACLKWAKTRGISLVLYDVTTLYFEVQEEDAYRKSGLSKERRLEPQIIIGLLVDQHGFPLGLQSFQGNTAETNTLLPVLSEFKKRHHLETVTVVADAAMLSRKNLEALTQAGYHYIVGSRLQKIPYEISEFQKKRVLSDNQMIVSQQAHYRIIYQYRAKRAALDFRNIQKQIMKAEKIISGKSPASKAKFLSLNTQEKKLNQALIDKARGLAGIKGYVTTLDIPNRDVIAAYHQLFQVEASFRMAKSDLKARPIFHRKKDSIEAHLTIVLTALAVSKNIEAQVGISIRQFIQTLRPIRSGTISINGRDYIANEEISPNAQALLKKFRSGH
jgi:transposase